MSFQGFLKQSTAVDILLGPFLDDTDGKTAETGLTLSQADIKLSKNGQALAQKTDATAAAADANGYYNCELDTTDTNTVGQLTIICHESGALPVRLDYHVVEEAVYDAMYAASAAGPLQSPIGASDLAADAITAAKIADDAISSEHINTGALTADAFAADALVAATFATGALTADAFAANALIAATFAASSLDGKGDWNTIVPDAAGTAATPTDVATALADIHLDHLLAATYDPASKPGVADALLNEIVENDGGVSRFTENALEQSPSGTGASAATIADAVWDEAQADHVAVGSFGVIASEIASILLDTGTDGVALADGSLTNAKFAASCLSYNLMTEGFRNGCKADVSALATAAALTAVAVDAARLTAERAAVLSDLINGGRLDLILDIIAADTTTDLPAVIATVQSDLDKLTGADGATLATSQGNYAPAKAGDAMTLTTAEDVYHADIDLSKDDTNSQDEYTITWLKNGVRVTSGITVPTIQVVKRSDGSDLVAEATPTQVGSTGSYKHDETANRITAGQAVLVVVGATIDAASRSFSRVISRDSSS
jgi:hypothetical protein